MEVVINALFLSKEKELKERIANFNSSGKLFDNRQRNTIKLFEFEGKTINIKSFKVPNLINKVVYKYFRKSKAKRSYEYATLLLEKGIGTPQPMAYFENFNWLGLEKSYYISEHLQVELTYRELVEIPDYPNHETILRQFTRFTFDLHQHGIAFLDHSPGNTLIKKEANGKYSFYLVDLNRMAFHDQMSFESRMQNFSRLTPKKEMIAVMSNEYSKCYTAKSEAEIVEKMWHETVQFQEEFAKKQQLKKKLKFWKS
ncbi:lipopolysaccharide kinase InaA family protein [Flavobacterium restrictum]|uniref:Kdo domain containing protein n=1 Tax=Flavobacterium restrictum TaxID=2594428 RepID=A0A553E8I6_9FLAO|nr:lipopolysaccharide kinase InaA family protein [Flavobacterium restrictum]TRX41369.1 Kdo domain containing protein [Flavobacterium restrictum]